jgi:TRAP-type C4-dicarboxylate transport system permease small subunit
VNPEAERSAGAAILTALGWLEDASLALLLGAMIALASLQIFLRNFFDEGFVWIDPLLRVLVLWVGLMGALAASRGNRHITIDALSRFLSPRLQAAASLLTSLATVLVSGLVAWHSGRFVAMEFEFGSTGLAGLPAWPFQTIMPFAFGVIALRYLVHAGSDAAVLLGLRPLPDTAVEHGSE